MATQLTKPVRRLANDELGGSYGNDKHRRLIITIIPGNGSGDIISLKPAGRREGAAKTALVNDIFSYMIRCEVNKTKMQRLREKLEKKRIADAARKAKAMTRKLFKEAASDA